MAGIPPLPRGLPLGDYWRVDPGMIDIQNRLLRNPVVRQQLPSALKLSTLPLVYGALRAGFEYMKNSAVASTSAIAGEALNTLNGILNQYTRHGGGSGIKSVASGIGTVASGIGGAIEGIAEMNPLAVGGLSISIPAIGSLISWLSSSEASTVPQEIKNAVSELGYSGAIGNTSASIIGEQFWDKPEIDYSGEPQKTYTVRSHRGLVGVGKGAMEHKTGGGIMFSSSAARKAMAVSSYGNDLNLERQFARTTTPNVRATLG